jgi:hypothetical protein
MPVYEVQGSEEAGYVDLTPPQVAVKLSMGALQSKQAVETEVDLILEQLRTFWRREPDERMRMISAMSARCTELGIHLHRLEGYREWRQVRTMQIDKLLQELDRQFKIASREVEVRRQDLDMSR